MEEVQQLCLLCALYSEMYFALFCFMYLDILSAYMGMHHVHALCPWKSEEDVKSSGTGVLDGCDLPCEC